MDRENLFEDLETLPELPIIEMSIEDVANIQREAAKLGMPDDELETMAEDDAAVVIEGPLDGTEAAA